MSKKKATAISLPLTRTAKIMTSAVGVESVNPDIVALATKATEIFLMDFARRAYDQFPSNSLGYDHLQKLVHSDPRYDFLIDATPKRIKFSEASRLFKEAREKQTREKEAREKEAIEKKAREKEAKEKVALAKCSAKEGLTEEASSNDTRQHEAMKEKSNEKESGLQGAGDREAEEEEDAREEADNGCAGEEDAGKEDVKIEDTMAQESSNQEAVLDVTRQQEPLVKEETKPN